MKKYTFKLFFAVLIISISGCGSSKFVTPPNGGASITVTQPIWITGIHVKNSKFSSSLPEAEENDFVKVVNAGYWLANTRGRVSQLVYSFDLTIKKTLSENKVYTRVILSNPNDKNSPIKYDHYLTKNDKSSKITHATVSNVEIGKTYDMSFEVFSDKERTKLITEVNQKIVSLVDNTSGCIKLDKAFMETNFGNYLDPYGKIIPIEKIIITCEKD